MLNKLTVTKARFGYEIKAFNVGREFVFQPGINLIVGDNGAGKSMMLHAILGNGKIYGNEVAKIEGSGSFRFLDTEKDNPRTKDPRLMPNGLFKFAVVGRTVMSHGEVMKSMLSGFHNDDSFEQGCLVLIDEPEMALSLKGQLEVAESWEKAVKEKEMQFIVATHSIVFMSMSGINIISLDDTYGEMKKWLKGCGK
jgi:predicted ATPase